MKDNKFHRVRRSVSDSFAIFGLDDFLVFGFSLAASGSFSALLQPYDLLDADTRAVHERLAATQPNTDFIGFRKPDANPNNTSSFRYHGIEDYHAAYLSRTTTPLQVAERLVAFLKADPLNAILELNENDLLAQARASTARYEKGNQLGL